MARIVLSVSGEGRGHAARARALLEVLRERHHLQLYLSGHALDMLAPLYESDPNIEIRPTTCMTFTYGPGNKLDYVRSFFHNLPFLLGVTVQVRRLALELERFEPDLVVSDFEPLVPRAAVLAGAPFMTIDHQSFLTSYDLSGLPATLQAYAAFFTPFVNAYYPEGRAIGLCSSFFKGDMRPDAVNIRPVGVFLRPEVRDAETSEQEYLVAYLRREAAGEHVLNSLGRIGMPIKVYGLGRRPRRGNLEFMPIDAFQFVVDLANGLGLVTTAGNQLIGEAIHLNKPVLAMPEPGNFEQHINAHFVRESGAGMVVEDPASLTPDALRRFLAQLPQIALRQRNLRSDGTQEAVQWIEGLLAKQSAGITRPRPMTESAAALGV